MRTSDYARILEGTAHLIELTGGNAFRAKAFDRAARTLRKYAGDLDALIERGEHVGMDGIGTALARDLVVIQQTGTLPLFEELRAQLPDGILELVQIQGLGPKKVKKLYDELAVGSLEELADAIESNAVSKLSGFGPRTQDNLARELERLQRQSGRTPLPRALEIAEPVVAFLRGLDSVEAAELAGSARRGRETVGDLDFIVAATDPEAVMQAFVTMPDVTEVLAHGPTKSNVMLLDAMSADIRVVAPDRYGSALHHFTGSKDHHVDLRSRAKARGLRICEYGVFNAADTDDSNPLASASETDVYAALGLPFIPPELREGGGELDRAGRGALPRLLELSDLRGDMHMHTTASDGRSSIEEMAKAAKALGYAYIVITDHSKSSVIANGLDEERLLRHMDAIDAVDAAMDGIRVLKGIEVDILRDGTLDLDHAVLDRLDFVVGSIHAGFRMDRATVTARLLRAIGTGKLHAIGHPTGRKLGSRDGYELDMEALIAGCLEHRVALEINASTGRLDLNDTHARMAAEAGVPIVINTDSHSAGGFTQMGFGVTIARRAWLGPEQVINTRPWDQVMAALGR